MFARLDQASARTGMPVNSIVIAACLEWMERHMPAASVATLAVPPPTPRWSTIRRAVELAVVKKPAPGTYPFKAFSEHAQRLLTRAHQEAARSGFPYIGTEHLLLASLGDPDSQATRALAALGLTEEVVRPATEKLLSRHEQKKSNVVVPTTRVKKVMELAFTLCGGDARVATGHILVALATEGEGIAAHVMKDLGADRVAIEAAVMDTEPET